MPAISLVVCVYQQRDLLERLIRESQGCYDELIVEHDVPDSQNVREVVEAVGGRFFERPPAFLQEPHWPFLWGQAKHDWIFRLDADEFPGEEMKMWLKEFRKAPEPAPEISGYTCIWPLWDGKREISKKWPNGRLFLFNKQRVRFIGMCEMSPMADGRCEPVDAILHHQPPNRKIYGVWNMLFRGQSKRGRDFIARCLLGKPTDMVCWRWENAEWPAYWEQIRKHPWRTAIKQVSIEFLRILRSQWQAERRLFVSASVNSAIYRSLTCLSYAKKRNGRRPRASSAASRTNESR